MNENEGSVQKGCVHCLPDSTIKAFNGYAFHDNGCISYVNESGHQAYLPFKVNAVELSGDEPLRVGDKVLFRIAANRDSKVILKFATNVRRIGYCLEKCGAYYKSVESCISSTPGRSVPTILGPETEMIENEVKTGVISTMSDTYGLIERSDIVSRITFDINELQGSANLFKLGSSVEFELSLDPETGEHRAKSIRLLANGKVVFNEIDSTIRIGRVACLPHTQPKRRSTVLKSDLSESVMDVDGLIVYDSDDAQVSSISFNATDRIGVFTLFLNDIVTFKISTDKRDGVQRAINVKLAIDQSFLQHREVRKSAIIALLDHSNSSGLLFSIDDSNFVKFDFNELIPNTNERSDKRTVIAEGNAVTFNPVKILDGIHVNGARRIRMVPDEQNWSVPIKIYKGLFEINIVTIY
ncbi:hypothetical protein ACOME3_009837 [Neoechinorhynchus agilis]